MAHCIACLKVACAVFRLMSSTESEFDDAINLHYFFKSANQKSVVFPVLEKVIKSPLCVSMSHFRKIIEMLWMDSSFIPRVSPFSLSTPPLLCSQEAFPPSNMSQMISDLPNLQSSHCCSSPLLCFFLFFLPPSVPNPRELIG